MAEPMPSTTGAEAQTGRDASQPRRPRRDIGRILVITLTILIIIVVAAILLNLGIGKSLVPDVGMMTSAEARATIEAAGFVVGTETVVATGTVAPDRVIGQAPPGGIAVRRKTPVDITITSAPESVSMPSLVGMTGGEATQAMEDRQIEPVLVNVYHDTVPIGEVYAQYPHAGSDALEGEVGVAAVSSGPPSADAVTVPSVEESQLDDAVRALEDAGLTPVDYYTNLVPEYTAGSVIRQVPAPGAKVRQGAEVVILVSAAAN